jgi:C-terminal processing protease CtpA/Prc
MYTSTYHKYSRRLTLLFTLLLGMVLGISILLYKQKALVNYFRESGKHDIFAKFDLINSLLSEEYLSPEALTDAQEQMREAALKAYVAGLDDPYTNYLTKEENTELVNILHDDTGISGIGAVVEKRENYVQIAEVIKN